MPYLKGDCRARMTFAAILAAAAMTLASAAPASAGDQEEANRLIVQSVQLLGVARDVEDAEVRLGYMRRILENLQRIVDVYSGSDHAVTLVTGGEVGGLAISEVEDSIAEIGLEIELAGLSAPGVVYEYKAPALYSAVIYEPNTGAPFVTITTSVSGMNAKYVTVNDEGVSSERWTGVCWDYIGEEGDWTRTQSFQFDCGQLFPATIGAKFQVVSDTSSEEGETWSEAWNLEVGFFGLDEEFGKQLSFAGVLERLSGHNRTRVLQEHVYSADLGIITRIVWDADPDTGEGGTVIQAVEHHQLSGPASAEILQRCASHRSGVRRLRECVCGTRFFEERLAPEELTLLATIAREEQEEAAEHSAFVERIDMLEDELQEQCRLSDDD